MWKSKEKEIPLAEALEETQRELQPYWKGTPPLFIPIEENILPLSDSFYQEAWIFCFLDPTDFNLQKDLSYLQLLQYRYSNHGIFFLVILSFFYDFLNKKKDTLYYYSQIIGSNIPFVIDFNLEISKIFLKEKKIPFLIFLKSGEISFQTRMRKPSVLECETEIQNHIRSQEPGIPFSRIIPGSILDENEDRIEFGKNSFFKTPSSFLSHTGIEWIGHWEELSECFTTQTAHSKLIWKHSGTLLKLFCVASSQSLQNLKISLNGLSLYEQMAGKDVLLDLEGSSFLQIQEPRTYSVLESTSGVQDPWEFHFETTEPTLFSFFSLRFLVH